VVERTWPDTTRGITDQKLNSPAQVDETGMLKARLVHLLREFRGVATLSMILLEGVLLLL
jgi:hypothetical protein